jgi:hypothetical protein
MSGEPFLSSAPHARNYVRSIAMTRLNVATVGARDTRALPAQACTCRGAGGDFARRPALGGRDLGPGAIISAIRAGYDSVDSGKTLVVLAYVTCPDVDGITDQSTNILFHNTMKADIQRPHPHNVFCNRRRPGAMELIHFK